MNASANHQLHQGFFVHDNDAAHKLSPPEVLVPFIVSILALAWTIYTMINHRILLRSRGIVILTDLLFLGGFIASVYYMHTGGTANCDADTTGSAFKRCSMYKAAFAFIIIDIITFFLSLWVPTLPREDESYAYGYPYLPTAVGGRRVSAVSAVAQPLPVATRRMSCAV